MFADGSFLFVSFPTKTLSRTQAYSVEASSYIRGVDEWRTHADPDWARMTYGDYCANPRAGALKRANKGDILLFWALLWSNAGANWEGFTGERSWYLVGALRIDAVLRGGDAVALLPDPLRERASKNAHIEGDERLRPDHYVFIGDVQHSCCFRRAVELGVTRSDGLLYQAITTAAGIPLSLGGPPAWQSSLRSCRPVWDLDRSGDLERARLVRDAISAKNEFDLLKGLE